MGSKGVSNASGAFQRISVGLRVYPERFRDLQGGFRDSEGSKGF